MYDTDLIKPVTVAQMVEAYQKACEVVKTSFWEIAQAEMNLRGAFGNNGRQWQLVGDSRNYGRKNAYHWNAENPEKYISALLVQMKILAWENIVEITGVKKMMSAKRIKEMEEAIENGDLPEITLESIFEQLASFADNAAEIRKEVLFSAYNILRKKHHNDLKTAKKANEYGVQKTSIIYCLSEWGIRVGQTRVNYTYTDRVAEIDKAFHLLAGKGIPDGYQTPLIDAINTAEGKTGETDLFSFKKYKNGNLHLTIKDDKLIEELNRMCGSGLLHK